MRPRPFSPVPTKEKCCPSDPGGALPLPLKCLPHWPRLSSLVKHFFVGAAPLVILLSCFAFEAEASIPVGRVLTITVERVNPAQQQFTFKHVASGNVYTAKWTRSTRFMRGTFRRYGPETLQKGVRAEVLYSTPTFGEPFVARVFLLDPATAARASK